MDPKRAVWMDVDESTTTAGAGPPSFLEGNEVRPQKEGCQESNSAQDLSVVDGSDDPVFFFFFGGFFLNFMRSGDPPQEDLAKSGYMSERQVELFLKPRYALATCKELQSKYGELRNFSLEMWRSWGIFFPESPL
jgi:hypothetical protein